MTMIQKNILLLAISLVLSPALATAAETCTVCPQIKSLLKKMDKVAPDPMNAETLETQDQLSGEALDIVKGSLTDKHFTPANAKAIVKLIVRTIPYDNSLDFERANIPAFQKLYKKPGSLLKSTIDEMQKSGEISVKDRQNVLELFGIVPSQG